MDSGYFNFWFSDNKRAGKSCFTIIPFLYLLIIAEV